jgi:hypothetical protein
MTPKQLAKLLVSKHFEIGSLIMEEAIQCALVTAKFMNNNQVIEEIEQLKLKEFNPNSPLSKYWTNKSSEQVIKQMELFT